MGRITNVRVVAFSSHAGRPLMKFESKQRALRATMSRTGSGRIVSWLSPREKLVRHV